MVNALIHSVDGSVSKAGHSNPHATDLVDNKLGDSPHQAIRKERVSSPPTTPEHIRSQLSLPRKILVLIVLSGAPSSTQTAILQSCVITLPAVSRHLAIPPGRQQWVISASSLASACSFLIWGRVADVYGRRGILRLGLVLMCLSCLVCPFIANEGLFDALRALQGIGGAAAIPSAVGLVFELFEAGNPQIYAVSAYACGFPLGNVMGNVIGGLMAEFLGWKWTFYILAILAGSLTVLAVFAVPPERVAVALSPRWKAFWKDFDLVGAVLQMAALMFLLVYLTEGNTRGWKTPWLLVLLVLSPCLLGIFAWWELRLEAQDPGRCPPLLKMSTFRCKTYTSAQIVVFLFWAAFNNFVVFATFLFQDYQGLTMIETTIRFLPSGITGICTVYLTSQLLRVVKGFYIVIFGTICVALPNLIFALPISANTNYWAYGLPAMVILTLGADTVFPCLSLFVMSSVSDADQAMGAAVRTSVGLALATAIQISVMNRVEHVQPNPDDLISGYRAAAWFSAAMGFVSAIVAIVGFWGTRNSRG